MGDSKNVRPKNSEESSLSTMQRGFCCIIALPAMSEQRLLDVTVAISFTSDYSKTDIFRACRGVIPNRLRNARLNVDRSLNPYEYASSPTVR